MSHNFISIIIPTYNEKENIHKLIERLSTVFSGKNYEIIIVDDNSKDGTIEVVNNLKSLFSVNLLVREKEKGLATAVLHGITYAKGDIISIMDADLQHPPEVSIELLKALDQGADLAIASRYIAGGKCLKWGIFRRINSKFALSLSHIFLPKTREIKDPMTGYFMFRRDKIKGVILKPIGYKILLELIVMGKFDNIVEIPFTFEERYGGVSKLRFSQQIDYLKHVMSLVKRSGELLRILKFVLVGASGVIVNLSILWFLTTYLKVPYYISAIISIESSIISNFLLNNYFTFSDRRSPEHGTFMQKMFKFNLNCLIGALIQYSIMIILTTIFKIHYLISSMVGIASAFIWNYLLSSIWIWK